MDSNCSSTFLNEECICNLNEQNLFDVIMWGMVCCLIYIYSPQPNASHGLMHGMNQNWKLDQINLIIAMSRSPLIISLGHVLGWWLMPQRFDGLYVHEMRATIHQQSHICVDGNVCIYDNNNTQSKRCTHATMIRYICHIEFISK